MKGCRSLRSGTASTVDSGPHSEVTLKVGSFNSIAPSKLPELVMTMVRRSSTKLSAELVNVSSPVDSSIENHLGGSASFSPSNENYCEHPLTGYK